MPTAGHRIIDIVLICIYVIDNVPPPHINGNRNQPQAKLAHKTAQAQCTQAKLSWLLGLKP